MRLHSAIYLVGLSLTLLVYSSCGPTNGDHGETNESVDSVGTPYSGSTAVGISYEVRSYESWLKAYKQHSDPAARLSILSSTENPNQVTVFQLTQSHEEARFYFLSEQFRETLESVGVTSEPVLAYFDITFRAKTPTEKPYRIGISHEVTDYESWKKNFDEDEAIRSKANLELRAISISADNPSSVYILLATDDGEKAKRILNSDEWRNRMTEAGARTEPVFAVFRVAEEKLN